jgi:hypothetical protein
VRLPGPGRLGAAPVDTRGLRLRLLGLAAAAVAGAVLAVVLTHDPAGAEPIRTATGGSIPVPTPTPTTSEARQLSTWPRDRRGWTIVLVSVPKVEGQGKAVAVAREALRKGLDDVGVLDSSAFASLRPGYWMAFAGTYPSEAEANGAVRAARRVAKGARAQRVAP